MAAAPEQWLAIVKEDALDADLPIIDPHHHLWDYPDHRYVASDFLADTSSGHNIRQSVFVECLSNYRDSGPDELKPVGETEYVRELAERIEGLPVMRLDRWADVDTWRGPRPMLCTSTLATNQHQLHAAAEELRWRAHRFQLQAEQLDAMARLGATG